MMLPGFGILTVAFICDDCRVFTENSDGAVKMWDIKIGVLIREVISSAKAVWRVAILEDRLLAMYSKGGNVLLEASWNPS